MTAARAPWRLGSNAAGAVLLVLACACAGGPGTPDGPVVNSPGSGAPPPTGRVDVQLTVSVPLLRRGGMRPNYVSPNTRSLTIGLVTVDGVPVSGIGASTVRHRSRRPRL